MRARTSAGAHLCVGLDVCIDRLPASIDSTLSVQEQIICFNLGVVEATADIAAAYKPNIAFYEALGAVGWEALRRTVQGIRQLAPDTPVIIDAKRGDIGSTNERYARALFDELGADAITVHPYLGEEALRPFLDRAGTGVFVLTRTSNPGAGEFQDLMIAGVPLYRHVARRVTSSWQAEAELGLVVGATHTQELEQLRGDVAISVPILIPGIGAQGGDVEEAVSANLRRGSRSFLLSASRAITDAAIGQDYAGRARDAARALDCTIRTVASRKAASPASA